MNVYVEMHGYDEKRALQLTRRSPIASVGFLRSRASSEFHPMSRRIELRKRGWREHQTDTLVLAFRRLPNRDRPLQLRLVNSRQRFYPPEATIDLSRSRLASGARVLDE